MHSSENVTKVAGFSLRHLRVFREVAKRRSMSAASQQIHLSQPAITQAIAKLEKNVNAVLFDRRRSGMYLTPSGEILLNRVCRALAQVDEGCRGLAKAAGQARSRNHSQLSHRITFVQLRALQAVAQAGNFSLAARAINVSQPSLHRASRDLERVADVEMFAKVAQGIELTKPARMLLKGALLAFRELEQGIAELNGARGRDSGHIVVGTLPLARSYILPHAINGFTARYPGTRLSIVDGPYQVLLQGLRHGEIDCLIGALRDPPPIDDVCQEPLFSDRLAIVARVDHPLTRNKRLTPQLLASVPWVVPRAGTPTRASFNALFDDSTCAPPPQIVETSSLVLIRALLLDSNRLTMISAHQVRHDVAHGLLAELPFEMDHRSRPIGLTVREGWEPTQTQVALLDCLREASQMIS